MECRVHPGREAHALCVLCGAPACTDCLVTLHGQEYCRPCLERLVAGEAPTASTGAEASFPPPPGSSAAAPPPPPPPAAPEEGPTLAGKSEALATVLALIFPGLGHLYLGIKVRGLQILVGFILAMVALDVVGLQSLLEPWFVLLTIFFSVFETREAIGRLRRGQPVPDLPLVEVKEVPDGERLIAYGLIGLGGLGLARVLFSSAEEWLAQLGMPPYQLQRGLLAVLLIAAGVWMLRGGRRQPAA